MHSNLCNQIQWNLFFPFVVLLVLISISFWKFDTFNQQKTAQNHDFEAFFTQRKSGNNYDEQIDDTKHYCYFDTSKYGKYVRINLRIDSVLLFTKQHKTGRTE